MIASASRSGTRIIRSAPIGPLHTPSLGPPLPSHPWPPAVSAQLAASSVIDGFGLGRREPMPFTWCRGVGIGLIVVGYLIFQYVTGRAKAEAERYSDA